MNKCLRNFLKAVLNYEELTKFSKTRFHYVSLVTVLRSQSRLTSHLPSKNRPFPNAFSSFCQFS